MPGSVAKEHAMGSRRRLTKKLKKLLPAVTVTLTTMPFVVWSPDASAFFPPIWPVSPPVTVVPPVPPVLVVPPTVPPVIPPIVPPVPPVPPVIDVPPLPPPPTGTPEPATIVSTIIGLGAVGGYALRRRQKNEEQKPDAPKAE
jgi:hypothetical protein